MAHQVLCLADAGYHGMTDLHTNSRTPKKKSKRRPLTPKHKAAKIMNWLVNASLLNMLFVR